MSIGVNDLLECWFGLGVYRESLEKKIIAVAAIDLLKELSGANPDVERVVVLHRHLTVKLVTWAEEHSDAGSGDAWQLWLLDQVLSGENTLGRRVSQDSTSEPGQSLRELAAADLTLLGRLYQFSNAEMVSILHRLGVHHPPSWDNGFGSARPTRPGLATELSQSQDWASLLDLLIDYYRREGVGILARFVAYRWDAEQGLVGVPKPDPVRIEELVGYEYQKQALIVNTRQFLAGLPCNNILMYGARGTGKSSLIKALLNEYSGDGLRLVEVTKEDMRHFATIVRSLRDRPHRYVLFADDLSYDDAELHYRELKAAMEGSVEGRPENVLLYATSNRRHLIKERFQDRQESDDEIHTQDTVQEKLSLADRFGLTLSFSPPTQAEFLMMVDAIARRRDISMPDEDLHDAALKWLALHNAPSGRTARQFIDDLEGGLRLKSRDK